MRYKWLGIIGLILLAVVKFMPLEKNVRLGLDLKGGIHLVVRVITDDALRAELDSSISLVAADFAEKKIAHGSIERDLAVDGKGYRVIVRDVDAENLDIARRRTSSLLPDFAVVARGSDIVAEMSTLAIEQIKNQTVEQARTTIRERIDQTGVSEPVIMREGVSGDRILVQLPGVQDPEYVKRMIGTVAFLELKLVDSGPFSTRQSALERYQGTIPPHLELLEEPRDAGEPLFHVVERVPIVTGSDLSRAQPGRDQFNQWQVQFSLHAAGAKKFGDATGKNVGRNLAIVLDNQIKLAPVINSRITDRGSIEGNYTDQEARELAQMLRAGALPAKIQYLEERTVDPWLGKESINKGVFTGLVSLAMVVALMLLYYRGAGINAAIALVLNGVLVLGALSALNATLTLPGIAGFILTLGMAVDANVLVFEAIRENIRAGQGVRKAVEDGFAKALITIVDSNLTTLLAAGSLWMIGSGPVRGFGVTLFIGLIINIFTAYFVSKTIYETFVLNREWKAGENLSI